MTLEDRVKNQSSAYDSYHKKGTIIRPIEAFSEVSKA